MVAGDVYAAQIVGGEEADDGSFDIVKLEDGFFVGTLLEAVPVWRLRGS